ncbi:MAG: hypothetical protein GY865_14960 [candidate division Zixibacteria bacterium]|nr:hypothetical protein [candidate division Zixibacteria bacterium]
MPCLEITMPNADIQIKEKLTKELTKAFDEATHFGAEIFGIYFNEYEFGNAASGGVICENNIKRPYLHMLMYCPRVSRITKQKLVESFSSVFTSVFGKEDWQPVIHICEHPYDNVGVNGKLLSDSFEACANSKFYYELPKD